MKVRVGGWREWLATLTAVVFFPVTFIKLAVLKAEWEAEK